MTSILFRDMFVLGLPVAAKILRPIAVYLFLIAGLRLAGTRELAPLNPVDLVVDRRRQGGSGTGRQHLLHCEETRTRRRAPRRNHARTTAPRQAAGKARRALDWRLSTVRPMRSTSRCPIDAHRGARLRSQR